jgi:hypothetical protein
MPTKAEAFPSRFFKAADLPKEGLALTIAKLEQEKIGPDQKLKWVVYFKGKEKQLVLNATNWDLIAAALREENSDNWIGKTIELYRSQTAMGGKLVDCIRCRRHRPPSQRRPAEPPKAPPPTGDDIDDDIDDDITF